MPPANLVIRDATESELPRVVDLIHLGTFDGISSEDPSVPLPAAYIDAFRAIVGSGRGRVLVAEVDGTVVGTVQYNVIPNLSHVGKPVAQLESFHVAAEYRSQGIGEAMVDFCVAEARKDGCFRVQLTSNKARTDAHRFYFRLGFKASHEGMKLAF